jgi:hypothetical protein
MELAPKSLPAVLAILACSFFALGCAPAQHDEGESAVSEENLTTAHPGAKALLAAALDNAPPEFLRCHTAPAVRPKLEISIHTAHRMGAATIVLRRFTGSPREMILEGTLEGIPRAGDLQGGVTINLGDEVVAFDYFAENQDDPNEITFRGKKIPFLCNAR